MSASILGEVQKKVHQLNTAFETKAKTDKETLALKADFEMISVEFDNISRYLTD